MNDFIEIKTVNREIVYLNSLNILYFKECFSPNDKKEYISICLSNGLNICTYMSMSDILEGNKKQTIKEV